jgi:ABC-2 type transport system ATP-binding protein
MVLGFVPPPEKPAGETQMHSANDVVIKTHSLGKSYGDVVALKALDLTVKKNSIFGFLGPNGAGKTTTIKLLLGLLFPTRGGASVFGHDIVREGVAIRSRIGYLPQNPRFYDYMTARQILRYTLGFYLNGPTRAIEERVEATLELVGLADKADRRVKGFSGGELQRVGIGQAQVHYPDLLILDEPAASLDPQGRRDVLEVMERLREHATVFYCTHILDDVQKVSDTVAILNHGELVANGPIEELLSGGDGTVYTVTMKGDVERACARVSQQPWVLGVEVHHDADATTWHVQVADAETAEALLLPLIIADGDVRVVSMGPREYELEDVFLRIVEGV